MSKYGNRKTNGFDSKKEARRYEWLRLEELAGAISNLETQVEYELIPSQRIGGKVEERAVKYKADFRYIRDGVTVVEDCKGFRTVDYVVKRKLMLWVHGIKILET